MGWHVEFDAASRHVEMTLSGRLSSAQLAEACDTAVGTALERDAPRVLTDCSGMQGGHDVFDLYFLARRLADHDHARLLREAVVMPEDPGISDMIRFWETACTNRGLHVRAFATRNEALRWLHEAGTTQPAISENPPAPFRSPA